MGYFGGEVTGIDECRAFTRQLIKEGADYIKITATGGSTPSSFPLRPAFNVDELKAVTDEAHKFGMLTATHSTSTKGVINSLDADVDMIIHCTYNEPDGKVNFREDVAERIGEQGAYVNPTLQVGRARIWSLTQKRHQTGLTNQDKIDLDEAKRDLDTRLDHNRRMIEMGLKVITGSDSSWGDYQLGNTVYETELLVHAGYSHMQGVIVSNQPSRRSPRSRRHSRHPRTRQTSRHPSRRRQPRRRCKRSLERCRRLFQRRKSRARFRRIPSRHAPNTPPSFPRRRESRRLGLIDGGRI